MSMSRYNPYANIAIGLFGEAMIVPGTTVLQVPWSWTFSIEEQNIYGLNKLRNLYCIVEDMAGNPPSTIIHLETLSKQKQDAQWHSDRMPQTHRIYQFKVTDWMKFKQVGTR